MLRRPLWTLLAGIVLLGTAFATPAAADPVLKPMFDGKTLDGWTASKPGEYLVKDGAIHSTGKSRGWLYYNKQQAGTFRWLFHLRQVKGNHAPSVLIWGVTQPINGLGAIQFQPPNGGHWDYRPGHNNSGKEFFTKYPHPKWDVKKWTQCEIVGNQATGIARMACCPLPDGATRCKATEVLAFKDKKAARVGPLAIQIHNSGIEDEYKNLQLEYPVADPDKLITT